MRHSLLRFSLLAAAALTLGSAHAQQAVSNGTLETWVTRTGDAPAQWRTTDDLLQSVLPGFPATAAVTKSTDKHAGSFAAKLTNVTTLLGTAPGFLFIGDKTGDANGVTSSLLALGGLPYTSRAARMQFYYKFSGTIASPDDRPRAAVMLTKTVGGVRQTVAQGQLYLTAAAAYTLADVPLTYQAGFAPDSIHIAFGSSDYDGNNFTPGNTLYVDDVVMTGTVAATRDAQLQAAVGVYPNPSPAGLFTLTAAETGLLTGPYTVTDALGRVVLRQNAAPANATGARPVDLRTQPAGVYSLRLDTPRGPVVHQLLIP